MPEPDFDIGRHTRSQYNPGFADEPIVMREPDFDIGHTWAAYDPGSDTDTGLHQDKFGRWVQEPTSAFRVSDDPQDDGGDGFRKDDLGRWVQAPKFR